jgi:NAD(P)-dependent dehydrogenase (short-subunit alcohol dehydrogenase family)
LPIVVGVEVAANNHPGDATWAAKEVSASGTAGKRAQKIAFTLRGARTVGENFNLLATINSPLPIAFTSSAPEIVRVNDDGTATALVKGRVTLTASQGGNENYAAAKAGLTGFSKSLAREVGSRGITVNCVAPCFIDTDMTRALTEAQRDALVGQVPLARFGQVGEVAAAVTFLASDGAGYVTGSTLHVNGGMLME